MFNSIIIIKFFYIVIFLFITKTSILDNIYTNYPNISANGILKTLFSDHYSLFCISKEKQNNKNNIIVSKQEFTEQNISKFNKMLSKDDWKTFSNNYFVEIGPKLTKNLNSSIDPLSYLNNNTSSIFFPEISENEILRTVNSLKNASAGWDHIPTFIAKRSLQYYLKPYIDSFNQ